MPSDSDRSLNPQDIATLLVTAFVLIAVVALKYCSEGRIEISTNDMLVTAIAAVLMLFVTGRIAEFEFGSKGLSVKAAFIAATTKRIERQVLPVQALVVPEKGPIDQIPEYVRQRVPAIHFTLGHGQYDPFAIENYLNQLTSYDFFRFVVFLDASSRFFGIVDARQLNAKLKEPNSDFRSENLAQIFNQQQTGPLGRLTSLPGFVAATNAVKRTDDKQDTLEKMDRLGVDWLPVVEENGYFAGIVEQSRLTASLILDVASRLKDQRPASKQA